MRTDEGGCPHSSTTEEREFDQFGSKSIRVKCSGCGITIRFTTGKGDLDAAPFGVLR